MKETAKDVKADAKFKEKVVAALRTLDPAAIWFKVLLIFPVLAILGLLTGSPISPLGLLVAFVTMFVGDVWYGWKKLF